MNKKVQYFHPFLVFGGLLRIDDSGEVANEEKGELRYLTKRKQAKGKQVINYTGNGRKE